MTHLNLTVDEVLSTTRAVRRRLDLTRPVERGVIEECIALAQQAPNGGNYQVMHFVAVTDAAQRQALAEVYRKGFRAIYQPERVDGDLDRGMFTDSVHRSAVYLYDHLHQVPVLLVPCRVLYASRDKLQPFRWATHFADAHPATWSFMLAARERGLGTCFTTAHLLYEEEAADVLGIEYERFGQTSLIPVAYTIGTDFQPVARKPVDEVLHWDRW